MTPQQDLHPADAFRNAAIRAAVSFLRARAVFRFLLGVSGAGLFIIGLFAALFWNISLLTYVSGREVAAVGLAGGLGALGLWYLSRPIPDAGLTAVESANQTDIAGQLKSVAELHSGGALTDEEFSRAKARILQ